MKIPSMQLQRDGARLRPARGWVVAMLLSAALSACSGKPDAGDVPDTPPKVDEVSSWLIVNARVVDGSGAPEQKVSVRVVGDRIEAVGDLQPVAGETVVDAGGKVLAPGFIDTHSHHDGKLADHRDAVAVTSQGVTTLILGQDGGSTYPLADYYAGLEKTPAAVNIASYTGHNSIRDGVMGEDFKHVATAVQVEAMRVKLEADMAAGSLGLSTGLEYDPGIYSANEEVVTLAREAARHGGRYISHMRSEDRSLWKALDELIDIGRQTGMPVQVSHMKLAMTDWWGQADRFIATMDAARAEGIKISGDVYPYPYWQSTLGVLFPERDFGNRKSVAFVLKSLAPPEGLWISGYPADPSLVGKTVAEIAKEQNRDPVDVVLTLLADETQIPRVIGTSMDQGDIDKLILWQHANICSDGGIDDLHPRGAGAFARILREYVRERKLLTLEQAVHKMSGAAADHMGLSDRGHIRAGQYADLVLFDPDTIQDHATIETPGELATGVDRVWVAGTAVFADGKPTGNFPGKVVRRTADSQAGAP